MVNGASKRVHLVLFCAGDRDGRRAPSQQNNSLKNEECFSERKGGNPAYDALVVFYGCLLVVIGSGAGRQKNKGRILPLNTKALIRALSHSDSLDFLRCRRCSSSRATLMICWISSPALVPISSTRVSASREDSSKASSFPSVCLRAISPCIAETINPAEDSPSCFNDSMLDTTSCGTLTVKSCDFVFLFAEDIGITPSVLCVSVYSKMKYKKALTCVSHKSKVKYMLSTGRIQQEHSWITETAKPRGALTPSGLLTTTVSVDNEVAMSNRITPPAGRASLSPNLFLWRFLALNRHDKKARPCRLSVEAATEREARRILASHFILSLAARLPVAEVRHA